MKVVKLIFQIIWKILLTLGVVIWLVLATLVLLRFRFLWEKLFFITFCGRGIWVILNSRRSIIRLDLEAEESSAQTKACLEMLEEYKRTKNWQLFS